MTRVPRDWIRIAFLFVFMLAIGLFFFTLPLQEAYYFPAVHLLFIAISAFVAFNVAYVIKRAYELNLDHTMFFLSLGFVIFASIWLFNAFVTPGSGPGLTSVFTWSKTLSVFLSIIVMSFGLFSYGDDDQNTLYDVHDQVYYALFVVLLTFLLLLATNPWIASIIPAATQLLATLDWIAFAFLIVVSVAYYKYHLGFRGLHYDKMSSVLGILAIAQLAHIFSQPWTPLWWLQGVLQCVGFLLLLVVFLKEYSTQKYFDEQISSWSGAVSE